MPIKKRPAAKKRTAKPRQNLKEQLDDLAILLAAYRNRLNDALSLLEGVDCFRYLHSQITEVVGCLDETIVWFSEHFEEIEQDDLLSGLRFYGSEILLSQLKYLGTPDPDEDDLDWTASDLEEDSVADSTQSRETYPPGRVASILDQEPDEDEESGSFGCTVKLVGLKRDVALISERLIEQIKVAGFKLHDDINRLDN